MITTLNYVLISLTLIITFGCSSSSSSINSSPSRSPIVQIYIDAPEVIKIGVDETSLLRVKAVYQNGMHEAFRGKISWSSTNTNIQVEPDGLLIGKKIGDSEIVILAEDLHLDIRKTVKIENSPRRIYFKPPQNWPEAHIWYWYLDGYADAPGTDENEAPWNPVLSSTSGNWPGPSMKQVKGYPGWFYFDIPRYDSSEFSGHTLIRQPTRLIFNDGVNNEKTKMYLRQGGCFASDNSKTLNEKKEVIIGGTWTSVDDCNFTKPNNLKVWAEPAGGPIFNDEVKIRFNARGQNLSTLKYTINGTPASETNGLNFSPETNQITIGQELQPGNSAVLCLFASTSEKKTDQECFYYTKSSPPGVKRLGAVYNKDKTTFSVWSPDKGEVFLWLDGLTIPMGFLGDKIAGYNDVYSVTVPGDFHLRPYHFIINSKIVRDPYAVMARPGTDFNIVMDMTNTVPNGGWLESPLLKEREDSIIYEISVRDFTKNPTSGVSERLRGTFLGMVAKGTRLNENGQTFPDIKTGLEHLQELGITHVQLLPIFDFGTCSIKDQSYRPGCYNWGYDPENFNVPEELFAATDPTNYVERIRELKTMINEFHRAGIRVVMDVVYNHSWTRGWQDEDEGERYLSQITKKYFFSQGPKILNISGAGNALNVSEPMVNRMIRDSLEYWAKEYHLDGFRFDLAGVFDYSVINEWGKYLIQQPGVSQNLLLYGEPWAGAPDPFENKHFRLNRLPLMKDSHYGAFNDKLREAISRGTDPASPGFAFNDKSSLTTVLNGLKGSLINSDSGANVEISQFAAAPEQSINYNSAHDDMTLWDEIQFWAKTSGADLDYQKRINSFAEAITLTSQGIPFIHGGSEMLRTKGGLPNTYRSPDKINSINWSWKKSNRDTFDFYRHLIAVRKAHPALRLISASEIRNFVDVISFDQYHGLISLRIRPTQRTNEEMYLIFNSGQPVDYYLPEGEWKVAMANSAIVTGSPTVNSKIRADGTAVTAVFRNSSGNH